MSKFFIFSVLYFSLETNRRNLFFLFIFFLTKSKASLASNFRSVSAVDANAVQRAKARAQYANMSRMKMAAGTASVRKYRIKLELFL